MQTTSWLRKKTQRERLHCTHVDKSDHEREADEDAVAEEQADRAERVGARPAETLRLLNKRLLEDEGDAEERHRAAGWWSSDGVSNTARGREDPRTPKASSACERWRSPVEKTKDSCSPMRVASQPEAIGPKI